MASLKCPVLTIHGEKDTRVPYNIARSHSKYNEQSSFLSIPNTGHGFKEPINKRKEVVKEIIKWVKNVIESN